MPLTWQPWDIIPPTPYIELHRTMTTHPTFQHRSLAASVSAWHLPNEPTGNFGITFGKINGVRRSHNIFFDPPPCTRPPLLPIVFAYAASGRMNICLSFEANSQIEKESLPILSYQSYHSFGHTLQEYRPFSLLSYTIKRFRTSLV